MENITAKTLNIWLNNHEAIVIDVREPDEYKSGHIPNAILIPVGSIQKKLLPEHAGKKLVIHCRSGRRSTMACEKLFDEDPQLKTYHLEGGIIAWQAEKYPLEEDNVK